MAIEGLPADIVVELCKRSPPDVVSRLSRTSCGLRKICLEFLYRNVDVSLQHGDQNSSVIVRRALAWRQLALAEHINHIRPFSATQIRHLSISLGLLSGVATDEVVAMLGRLHALRTLQATGVHNGILASSEWANNSLRRRQQGTLFPALSTVRLHGQLPDLFVRYVLFERDTQLESATVYAIIDPSDNDEAIGGELAEVYQDLVGSALQVHLLPSGSIVLRGSYGPQRLAIVR